MTRLSERYARLFLALTVLLVLMTIQLRANTATGQSTGDPPGSDVSYHDASVYAGQTAGWPVGRPVTVPWSSDETPSYSLSGEGSQLFSVDTNGQVWTATTIPETPDSYTLTLFAADTLGQSHTTRLNIAVRPDPPQGEVGQAANESLEAEVERIANELAAGNPISANLVSGTVGHEEGPLAGRECYHATSTHLWRITPVIGYHWGRHCELRLQNQTLSQDNAFYVGLLLNEPSSLQVDYFRGDAQVVLYLTEAPETEGRVLHFERGLGGFANRAILRRGLPAGYYILVGYMPAGQFSRDDSIFRIVVNSVDTPEVQHSWDSWHEAALDGKGTKVGVIQPGFRFLRLAQNIVPSLNRPIHARCHSSDGTTSSSLAACEDNGYIGAGVLETVLAVAPEADMYISDAVGPTQIRDAVNWMVGNGVDVIVHGEDYEWEGPGDGTAYSTDGITAAAEAAVRGGALWVNAASRQEPPRTWYGEWDPSQRNRTEAYLDWGDNTPGNAIKLSRDDTITAHLRWDDRATAATRNLDLYVFGPNPSATPPECADSFPAQDLNSSVFRILACSRDVQAGRAGDRPQEVLTFSPTWPYPAQTYEYYAHYSAEEDPDAPEGYIVRWDDPPDWIQFRIYGAHASVSHDLEHNSGDLYTMGSPGESNNPGIISVGSSPWHDTDSIETFSTLGPTPDGRIKPDLFAINHWRPDPGLGTYLNTNLEIWAKAYQPAGFVAGMASLVKQAFPNAEPTQVAEYLRRHAIVKPHGYGLGLAGLPSARGEARLTVSDVRGQARLVWERSQRAESYRVMRRVSGQSDYELIATVPATQSEAMERYHDAGAALDTSHEYRVVPNYPAAVVAEQVTSPLPYPDASLFLPLVFHTQFTHRVAHGTLTLRWTPLHQLLGGGEPVLIYRVDRRIPGGDWSEIGSTRSDYDFKEGYNPYTRAFRFTDDGYVDGQPYEYRVIAQGLTKGAISMVYAVNEQ